MIPFLRLPWSRAPNPPLKPQPPWLLPEFPGIEDADEVNRLVPIYERLLHEAPLLEESLQLQEVRKELRANREEGSKKLRVKHDALEQKYWNLLRQRARELAAQEVYELRFPTYQEAQQRAREVAARPATSPKRPDSSPKRHRISGHWA